VVIGAFNNKRHSLFKILVSRIKSWFDQKLLGKPAHIQTGPFKLYRAEVVNAMLKIKTPYPFISALMFYVTQDIVMLELEHNARKFGKSGFTLKKMIRSFSNLLINNSSFLLQVVSVMGLTISIISFILGIYFIIKNLTIGIGVPGWTSLIVVILITNGLILFAIGIVGEYLIRIISGVENRPPYIIRRQYRKHHSSISVTDEA
jgi:dolichol-phosphate mannosyltransferase/undecaprenyl-phosphate 4-deoxy-4-formamido-L-arabinose transferase